MSRSDQFDPFDEKHRDKLKRRRREEIVYENKQWEERIDNHFRRALTDLKNPDYVEGNMLMNWINSNPETNLPERLLRRNTEASMGRIGYEKMANPCSKDGRFKVDGCNTFVYRLASKPEIGKRELKQALAWTP